MDKRICKDCNNEKDTVDFARYKDRKGNYAYMWSCKECYRNKTRKHKEKYYNKNKEVCQERSREWNKNNKEHKAEVGKNWRENNKEEISRKKKEYYSSEQGKKIMYQATVKQRAKPEEKVKQRARWAVSNAIRSGNLLKPTSCSRCSEVKPPEDIHAHHEDYNRPLDVIWVCGACHKEIHNYK